MDSTGDSDEGQGLTGQHFLNQLADIQQDSAVRGLAQRLAGDTELARDALSQAYGAVARRGPDGIEDLRRYYCRVLINAVKGLRSSRPSLIEDFEQAAEAHQDRRVGQPLPRPVDETVCSGVLAETWFREFRVRSKELIIRVHRRSPDQGRYQMTIVTIAERLLRAIVTGDVSDADANPQLAAAYPEWFAEPRCTQNNRDQRCHRAREDVRDLLRTIVDHDDLLP
jgi:hypothetical protein